MDKDTTKSTLNKVFESFPYEDFCNLVDASQLNKYVKKLKLLKLFYILVIAQMAQIESLLALADKINQDKALQKALQLPPSAHPPYREESAIFITTHGPQYFAV